MCAMRNVQPGQTPASGNELGAKESESHLSRVLTFRACSFEMSKNDDTFKLTFSWRFQCLVMAYFSR